MKPCYKATRLGPHDWLRQTKGINRAVAEAVERHETKDPGMRGILKRASFFCHSESELQKKIALDTAGLDTTLFSLFRWIISIGAQPSVTTSTDKNTGTGDVTREARTGPTQDATRASSSDDIGDDVVMSGESADENRAEHPSSSRAGSRRRITTKREPREVRGCAHERHRATRSKKNIGENNGVGAPSFSYHTRGTGLIPQEK